ncbi:hypothetical protein [Spiroplasma endosymbiont of Labia minor]|uniref:hypothetical protein n=1 Tax=Spiroplasma endosymbiont of Labia minor TaxID=3066305 RepID=UPI0030D1C4ED
MLENKLEAMYAGRVLILKKKHKVYTRKSPRDYFKKYKPWGSLLKTKKFYLLITFILQIMLNVTLLFLNDFVRCFMNNVSILFMDNLKSIFIGFSIIYFIHIILNGIIQLILKSISNVIYRDAIKIFLNWFTNISNEEYDKISYDLWLMTYDLWLMTYEFKKLRKSKKLFHLKYL